MKVYRVRYTAEGGNSGGFSWHTSRAEAKQAAARAVDEDPREYELWKPEIEHMTVRLTKAGMLSFMRDYASHPDNG